MAKAPDLSLSERFRASPSFSLAFTMDGRTFVAKETEPYIQFWLSERYRILLSMFSGRRGAAIGEAIDGYLRLTGEEDTEALRGRLHRAAIDMVSGGVLIGARDDVSRYSARIVDAYLAHRPFPPEVTAHVVRAASIGEGTRVLDLAGGPGDFAVQLAATSRDVSMMELSGGFVKAAARRAAALGRPLQTIHDSCNRLVYLDDEYDVVTVAQALHWLDDVLVCRGLCRVLRPDGSFFVIHGAIELDDAHPLAYVLGHDSVLGRKERQPFLSEVWPIARRLSLLFEALDAPDVQRIDLAQQWGAPGHCRAVAHRARGSHGLPAAAPLRHRLRARLSHAAPHRGDGPDTGRFLEGPRSPVPRRRAGADARHAPLGRAALPTWRGHRCSGKALHPTRRSRSATWVHPSSSHGQGAYGMRNHHQRVRARERRPQAARERLRVQRGEALVHDCQRCLLQQGRVRGRCGSARRGRAAIPSRRPSASGRTACGG